MIPLGYLAYAVVSPPVAGVITYDVVDLKPLIITLAALAIRSAAAAMAELVNDFAISIELNTLAPVG